MAVYQPSITSVTLSSNPVNINTAFLMSVSATEVEVTMYSVSKISGAAICGETISLATSKEVS